MCSVLVLVVALSSCGIFGRGPFETARAYYTAVDKADVEGALACTAPSAMGGFGEFAGKIAVTGEAQRLRMRGGIERINRTNVTVRGDHATVDLVLVFTDHASEEKTVTLLKTNEGWRVQLM